MRGPDSKKGMSQSAPLVCKTRWAISVSWEILPLSKQLLSALPVI
jgi:hypothetical protein